MRSDSKQKTPRQARWARRPLALGALALSLACAGASAQVIPDAGSVLRDVAPRQPADRIIAVVRNETEAEVALTVLEKGVRGGLVKEAAPALIRKIGSMVKGGSGSMELVPFTITAIRPIGMGDRVCVDTVSILGDGEGILVGNTSSAFLLVQAETLETPTSIHGHSGSMPVRCMPILWSREGRQPMSLT